MKNNAIMVLGALNAYSSKYNMLTANDVALALPDIDPDSVRRSLKDLFEFFGPDSENEIANEYYNFTIRCYRKIPRDEPHGGDFVEVKKLEGLSKRTVLFYYVENKLSDEMISVLKTNLIGNQYLKTSELKNIINVLNRYREGHANSYKAYDQQKLYQSQAIPKNENVFYKGVNVLMNCIEQGRQAELTYGKYTFRDDKLVLLPYGETRVINPYALLNINGYYYLICTHAGDKYTKDTNELIKPSEKKDYTYRLDRICKVEQLEDKREANPNKLRRYLSGTFFDAAKYKNEHPIMMGGDACVAEIECSEKVLNNVIDTFGTDLHLVKTIEKTIEDENYENEKKIVSHIIKVKASAYGIMQFCQEYINSCMLLSFDGSRELPLKLYSDIAAKANEYANKLNQN